MPRPGAVDPGSLPFDLGAVIAQVHFAYRPSERAGRFEGGHSTYAVEADAASIRLVPYHTKRGADAVAPTAPSRAEPAAPMQAPDVIEGRPLRLATKGIERGGVSVSDGERGEARVESDGHLAIARGAAVETYRNREEGVEQSWEFASKPSGDGDLVVLLAPSGLRYVGETAAGLHFADARTGLGFRYGHGTWVDGEGDETPIPARYVGGAIELRVPADVVEGSGYPAVLDPTISPEFGMDDPVAGSSAYQQTVPSVASNGTNYLVVWQDGRRGSMNDIFGTRVTSGGVVSDPSGLALSTAVNNQTVPSVASNGTDYLVVWQDFRGGVANDIYGTRVTSGGVVSDPSGLALATVASQQYAPSVASNGTDYLVAWQDFRNGLTWDIYGTRVTSGGVVNEPDGLALSTAANEQSSPSVASNGTDYLVVWQDYRGGSTSDLYGTRVTSGGVVNEPSGLALSTAGSDQIVPSVASNGTDYLVVWQDSRSGTTWDIYGTRVTGGGVVNDASGLALSTAANHQYAPSAASNGTNYLVVWQDGRSGSTTDIYGTRVTTGGVVSDASGLALSTAANNQSYPSVASNGTDFLVAWQDNRSGSSEDIYGTRVTSGGVVNEPSGLALSTAANLQDTPSVASNGTDYLVVWQDFRSGATYDIYGTRVTSAGVVSDASGLVLSAAANTQSYPSVASNGTDYLVVWQDFRSGSAYHIYGTRVTSGGVVNEPSGLAVSTSAYAQDAPSVASNGTDYLVVWSEYRALSKYDIDGTRVTSAGVVSDPSGLAISAAANDQRAPSVASNGTDYLVIWEDRRSGPSDDIYGTRVTSGGVVNDASGLALSTATNNQTNASVASNGTDYLAVWHDSRNGSMLDIYGTRVTSGGVVNDASGLALSTAANSQTFPSVTSNGTDYLVVWQDLRSGSSDDVYGTRVVGGVVESPSGIAFAADTASDERTPAISGGTKDAYLLVYHRFVVGAPYGAIRARARLVRYGSSRGAACGADTDCESGFCTDGVCCSAACGGGVNDCQACSIATGAPSDGTCAPLTATMCSDGNGCTAGDTCSAGTCGAGATNPCDVVTTCTDGAGESFSCSACPAGTYSADGTGTTACTTCPTDTYSAAGATTCAAWTNCAAGAYESTSPSATRDRVCTALTDCGPGQYESTSPSATSDRVCSACASGEYSTTTNAASCAAWTACIVGEYESSAPSAIADRVCTPTTVCSAGEYQSTAPTATSDAICTVCSVCDVGQIESAACTSTTDTVCVPTTVGDGGVGDGGVDDGGIGDGGIGDGDVEAGVDGGDVSLHGGACGCTTAGAPRSWGWPGLGLFAILVGIRRARRRARGACG